ncbi:restriction endonuclease PLD domain-containing protein [Tardiphaga sp. 1201_B9_N1_1]|uniref:phospholipase D family protein n=1 Tax=unclassified Tardiphaga TaxID=2631404 RepID=UPI003F1EE45F
MKVGARLFISDGLKSESKADDRYAGLSADVLRERMAEADHVFIISAYYDADFVESLFVGKIPAKTLTIVVNRASASALPAQMAELKKLKQELRKLLNRSAKIEIKLAAKHRFLHTKLYHFRRGKWARTLVGSANSSANGFTRNDELLVELHGRDSTIEEYIDWTSAKAESCDSLLAESDDQRTLEAFLRDGYVYFKSNRTLPNTINCFDQQTAIADALQRSALIDPLPFHDEQSIGLLNILKLLDIETASDGKTGKAGQVNMTACSIETCFGFWVPVALQEALERRIEKASDKRTEILIGRGQKLARVTDDEISTALNATYFNEVDRRLKSVSSPPLTTAQKSIVERRILDRAASLRGRLSDQAECRRLARSLSSSPVPEMWEDRRSKDAMIESFCEYVSWRLQRAPIPKLIRAMTNWFGLTAGDSTTQISEKIEAYFDGGEAIRQSQWQSLIGTDNSLEEDDVLLDD